MILGDDMTEGSLPSLILNSVDSKQNGDVLSPEDVAWADSCLINDPETSESNWNSLKDALLHILSSGPERDGFSGGTDFQILDSSEETKTSGTMEITVDDNFPCNEEAEKNIDDHLIYDKTDTLRSRAKLENAFLPAYREDPRQNENCDAEVNLGVPSFVMEPSTDDIFRVWNLEIPAAEDGFIKQLNMALLENSLQSTPSTSNDSGVWKGLKDESLDDLISGIGDLSLNQNSG